MGSSNRVKGTVLIGKKEEESRENRGRRNTGKSSMFCSDGAAVFTHVSVAEREVDLTGVIRTEQ